MKFEGDVSAITGQLNDYVEEHFLYHVLELYYNLIQLYSHGKQKTTESRMGMKLRGKNFKVSIP